MMFPCDILVNDDPKKLNLATCSIFIIATSKFSRGITFGDLKIIISFDFAALRVTKNRFFKFSHLTHVLNWQHQLFSQNFHE